MNPAITIIDEQDAAAEPPLIEHGDVLSIMARTEPQSIKDFSEYILDLIGEVNVRESRTGLVMTPMKDTVKGTDFHLGEVLVAEAHIDINQGKIQGYGMVVGRDLEHAMAMAIIDAAWLANIARLQITNFLNIEKDKQIAADNERLQYVNSTRVEMDTF